MATFRYSLLLAFSATRLLAQQPDWAKLTPEIMERFTGLLRIDTSNPPGNETKAATYLKEILEKEGIPCQLFALEPERANLVARLKGSGAKRPILLMGHTDVVGVQKEKWTTDPFTPTRKDGFIYARGATDDKNIATAGLIVMSNRSKSPDRLRRADGSAAPSWEIFTRP